MTSTLGVRQTAEIPPSKFCWSPERSGVRKMQFQWHPETSAFGITLAIYRSLLRHITTRNTAASAILPLSHEHFGQEEWKKGHEKNKVESMANGSYSIPQILRTATCPKLPVIPMLTCEGLELMVAALAKEMKKGTNAPRTSPWCLLCDLITTMSQH